MADTGKTLLAFSLGPVQEFIAAARTARDLWAGSYLLSWLTAHAVKAVEANGGTVILPKVATARPAVLRFLDDERAASDDTLLAALPNTFIAELAGDQATGAAAACERAVKEEWLKIAGAVHDALNGVWQQAFSGWDHRWDEQIRDFWEVRLTCLPAGLHEGRLRELLGGPGELKDVPRAYLGRLAAAEKMIRRYPRHEYSTREHLPQAMAAPADPGDTRPKCSLLGAWARMGPPHEQAQRFWEEARTANIVGARLNARDRLCAVSLVKRFAWACYLSKRMEMGAAEVRFPDTETIAAAAWLARSPDLMKLSQSGDWYGAWLTWKTQDEGREEGEPKPDAGTWRAIQAAKEARGAPPVHYAVLLLDGDKMGERLGRLKRHELADFSREMAGFASAAKQHIEAHHGRLVYAGGDDLLALLPVQGALEAAREVREAFGLPGGVATCSAGLAVAHVMQPLREVLQAARAAEKAAKDAGRDRLAICAMRRSGEHATVPVLWNHVPTLEKLASAFAFAKGASSRWTHEFRRELDYLPREAMGLELARSLKHHEGAKACVEPATALWEDAVESGAKAEHGRPLLPKQYVLLVQSAEFLARQGKE